MIYVSSSCLKKNNIAEIIEELARNDIRNIELSGGTDYYSDIESDLKKLKHMYNLQYACHAYFPPPKVPFVVNLASCNDKIYQQSIDHYIQCIDMLKRMDCKILSVHAGFLIEVNTSEIGKKLSSRIVYDKDKAYDRFCTAYEKISRLCNENGIDFFLENNVLSEENYREFEHHNYMMMTDYDSIMEMKKQLEFNLLLDLGHLYVSSNTLGLDFIQECRCLAEYVKWLHVSENYGIIDEHKPLLKNSEIMKQFYKLYYTDMNVTLETAGNIDEVLMSLEIIKNL